MWIKAYIKPCRVLSPHLSWNLQKVTSEEYPHGSIPPTYTYKAGMSDTQIPIVCDEEFSSLEPDNIFITFGTLLCSHSILRIRYRMWENVIDSEMFVSLLVVVLSKAKQFGDISVFSKPTEKTSLLCLLQNKSSPYREEKSSL